MTIKRLVAFAGTAMVGTAAFGQSATDVDRAYAAELTAAASERSSSTGHDGQFNITDGGGNYRLNVGGRVQFQYILNFRDDDAGVDEDFTNGFRNKEVDLAFTGNIINPNFSYAIVGNFGPEGSFTLEDAWGRYDMEGGTFVQFGQMEVPLLWEEMVDDHYQLDVDESFTTQTLTGGYTQGVAVGYQNEQFQVVGVLSDGARTANTEFNSGMEADWSLTGRVDWVFAGDWSRFQDFTSWQGSDYAGRVGGAIHWQTSGDTGGGAASQDLTVYTVDAGVEGDGWNAFAFFVGANIDPETGDSMDTYGFGIQGGIFVDEQWELFGRWDALLFDDDLGLTDDDHYFITFGTNYYFIPESHAARFTGDFVWALSETADLSSAMPMGSAIVPNPNAGILGNPDDGEFAVRLQMQFVF